MNNLLTLEERPTMVFRCLQNEMSFLKARKSNSSCVKEMRERKRERERERERVEDKMKPTMRFAYMKDRYEYCESKEPCTCVQKDPLHIIKLLVCEP